MPLNKETKPNLQENISHAEAFEMAMRDQNEISVVSDTAGLRMSAYRQQRRIQGMAWSTATRRRERTVAETRPRQNSCRGSGSYHHGGAGSDDRPRMCAAWGQTCRACGKQNHFEMVCQLKGATKQGAMQCIGDEEAAMNAFIAHIVFTFTRNSTRELHSSTETWHVLLSHSWMFVWDLCHILLGI